MEIKILEIRDRMTFIPLMAIRIRVDLDEAPPTAEQEVYLLRRSGFDRGSIYNGTFVAVVRLNDYQSHYDPYHWANNITMQTAHQYIAEEWDTIVPGSVVDCEFIRGETSEPKKSESLAEAY